VTSIGTSVRRADGLAKVRGAARYAIDLSAPRLLHAKVLRSPVAAGRIARLDTARAAALPGVRAIVTGDDCPNRSGWIVKDQTLFARGEVRYVGEPIAAVAAETPEDAEAALAAIELELEEGEPLLDVEASLAEGARLIHPGWESYGLLLPGPRSGNVAWETELVRGDVGAALARPDVVVVEDEFRAPRQHQAYVEPRAALAEFDAGRWTIRTTTQFPFLVRDRVAEFMGVPPSRVRVLVTAVGGGFGGKIDANPEPIAALLARRSGRPVKLVYTRREEFLAATPRENAIVRLRTAVTEDGELVAQQGEVLLDNGAYSGETAAIGSVPPLVLPSAYRFGAVHYVSKVVYTNTPPTGAYRGICGPYLVFAAERHLDNVAARLGLDRREFRLRNLYRPGDSYPVGQELLDAEAFEEAFARIEEVAPWAEVSRRRPLHGVGLAAVSWLTNPMPGAATLKLNEDGTVGLVTAATECGTGAVATGLVQIAAEELGVSPDDVVVTEPDTDASPYDAGAQGSRTVFNVGNAIRAAAADVRSQVFETAAALLEASPADLELADGRVRVAGSPNRSQPLAVVAQTALWTGGPIVGSGKYASPPIPFDPGCVTGAFFTTFNAATYHVHLAEVEVDPDTGKVTILRYVVAQDVGRAINPAMIEGQIEGGVAQGIGYALYENVTFADGAPVERSLEDYRLPTALDVPPIETILLEHPAAHGPYGAKGVAEPPVIPVAAAIANAVSDAVGKPFDRLPITPFDVLAALKEVKRQ